LPFNEISSMGSADDITTLGRNRLSDLPILRSGRLRKTMNFIPLLFAFALWIAYRVIRWQCRIARIQRTMPVIPVIVQPFALIRKFWPQKWQTWHNDWQFQRRKQYDDLGTGMVPLIALFGLDSVYISDADVVAEISSVANAARFPKDVKLYGRIFLTVSDE
jgi:hypothetical protein